MTPKLKQLCSAHALAATIASGMLISAAVWAVDCVSTSAVVRYPPDCGTNTLCSAYIQNTGTQCDGNWVYWCCTYPQQCGYAEPANCGMGGWPPFYAYGYCCPYP